MRTHEKTDGTTVTSYSCAETAKLMRPVLKATFPGVKFSVRSDTYANGASIRVSWTDGPTEPEVKRITELFCGASFDGMIDLKSYHDSIAVGPDGTPMVVSYGADFVFTERTFSPELLDKVAAEFKTTYGFDYKAWDEVHTDHWYRRILIDAVL